MIFASKVRLRPGPCLSMCLRFGGSRHPPEETRFDPWKSPLLTLGPLKSRREAAAISFTLKLLDGKGRGVLDAYAPVFVDNTKLHNYSTQNAPKGLQIKDRSRHKSLISFDRSYLGCIRKIWKKLPNELVQKGAKDGWLKIKKSCTISITKVWKLRKELRKRLWLQLRWIHHWCI